MRARRSLVAVSVAALAALSLAACGRSAPDVAAYVGDTRYSVERVDAIYDDAQRQYADAVRNQAPQTPSPEELRSPVTRQDVLNLLVALDLGKRVAAEKGLQVTDEVSPEQLQQPLRMPATTEYTKLWGEWVDLSATLQQSLPPADLSDESLMAVYRAIEKTGAIQPGLSVDQVRQAFGEAGFVRSATALSTALAAGGREGGHPRQPPVRGDRRAVARQHRPVARLLLPALRQPGRPGHRHLDAGGAGR